MIPRFVVARKLVIHKMVPALFELHKVFYDYGQLDDGVRHCRFYELLSAEFALICSEMETFLQVRDVLFSFWSSAMEGGIHDYIDIVRHTRFS